MNSSIQEHYIVLFVGRSKYGMCHARKAIIYTETKNIDIKSHLQDIKTFHEIGNVDVTMGTLKRYNRTREMLQPVP